MKKSITKSFTTSRRFVSTICTGTGIGSTFAIAAIVFTNEYGAVATAFPVQTHYNPYMNIMVQAGDTLTLSTTSITTRGGDTLNPVTPNIVGLNPRPYPICSGRVLEKGIHCIA